MTTLLAELSEERWQHLSECELCSPTAWVQGEELCDVGEDIRRRIKAALGEAVPLPCASCNGTGYVIVRDAEGREFARRCAVCKPVHQPAQAYRSPLPEDK